MAITTTVDDRNSLTQDQDEGQTTYQDSPAYGNLILTMLTIVFEAFGLDNNIAFAQNPTTESETWGFHGS